MVKPKYTEVLHNLLLDPTQKEEIQKAMSTYPIYTPKKEFLYGFIPTREELNKKILDYYRFREIGFETPARFVYELEVSLNEIMPYYNQLYKSIDVMNELEDIFGNVDIEETYEEESSSESKGNTKTDAESEANSDATTSSNVENFSKNVNTETPQGNISLMNTEIDKVTHASDINWSHNTSNDEATSAGTDTTSSSSTQETTGEISALVKHTMKKKGNQGVNTYAHDLLEFRELFTNIEQQIINDRRIAELFMGIY